MAREHQPDYSSQWAAIESIASKIGCTAQTLRNWVRQSERDAGHGAGLSTTERDRLKASAYFPRRSWTADSSHEDIQQRTPRGVWSRADLQGAADRPIDVLRTCGATSGSGHVARACATRRAIVRGHPARVE